MKQETIEKAAKTKPNYTWSNPILTVEISIHTGKDSPQTKTTMKQDAAVWHDASEEPRIGDRIIAIDEDNHIVDVGYFGNSDRIMDGHRWAYIDDLLPERKEEAK